MKYASVCSGIEAPTVAWHRLGWKPVWFSEIEKFPCRVLKHYYPDVPNLGDMTQLNGNKIYEQSTIDLLVGGTPCQSFSIAGLRGGLDDERGNLALEYCRILVRKRPRWFVWENVPGVLSSNGGKDFACILSAFTGKDLQPEGIGNAGVLQGEFYSVAWRILDAQYFGVPQRRRRIFVVGYLGNDWRPPFAVLFERESLRGYPAPGGKSREKTAALTASGVGTCGADDNQAQAGHLIKWPAKTASTLNAHFGEKQGLEDQHVNTGCPLFVPVLFVTDGQHNAAFSENVALSLNATNEQPYIMVNARQNPITTDIAQPLDTKGNSQAIVFDTTQITSKENGSNPQPGDPCHPLTSSGHPPVMIPSVFTIHGTPASEVASETNIAQSLRARKPGQFENSSVNVVLQQAVYDSVSATLKSGSGERGWNGDDGAALVDMRSAVRRLTPLECERLQGFPDNYTDIPGAADGPRYKAIGNSMAVPVMEWIGRRIDQVDKIINPTPKQEG